VKTDYLTPKAEEHIIRSPSVLRRLAFEKGCEAVICGDDEIQVDLDNLSLAEFRRRFILLREHGLIDYEATAVCWQSKSGNWHAVVTLPEPLEARRRIFLALALGSDEVREILNLVEQREASGTIVLFRPKGAVIRNFTLSSGDEG
jgi:hypothetical protein